MKQFATVLDNFAPILLLLYIIDLRVVTGEKNSPTVAHACRKRRLKCVLGAWGYNWATHSPGDINMEIWSSRFGGWSTGLATLSL
jgi:hypothetical protein